MRVFLWLLLALSPPSAVNALVGSLGPKVIVTGAAGRTGKLVFSSLTDSPSFEAVGLVRTEASAKRLMKYTECGIDHVVVSDITQLGSDEDSSTPQGLAGAEAMIICTSSVPYISKGSALKAIMRIPLNIAMGRKALNPRDLRFRFRPGQYPEKVDYEGQVKQIDLAKRLGIGHVIVVSSMGGTDPSNFLNYLGKDKYGNGNGDILLWKRKAEKYLTESGLSYTIIHPGGLIDEPPGEKNLVLNVDDALLKEEKKSISRADVANLCVAALAVRGEQQVSFDCIARDATDGGEKVLSAEEALSKFLATGKTTDYSL